MNAEMVQQFNIPTLLAGVTAKYGERQGEEMGGKTGKHVVFQFANGYEISVIDAYGSYGVEAAIFDPDGKLYGDDVHGWVTPEQLTGLIDQVNAL